LAFSIRIRSKLKSANNIGATANFLGALGFGWTHTYSAFLDTEVGGLAGSFIRIVDETGRGHYFNEAAAGVFEGFFNEKEKIMVVS
jgi:hypothetical protein